MHPEQPQPGEILRVEVGSTATGIAVDGSDDLDLRAIVVEPMENLVVEGHNWKSKSVRTQPEGSRSGPDDIDLEVHPLRRFAALAAQGNPSLLLTFYAPVIGVDSQGIQSMAPWFWSSRCLPRFRGYMKSQCLRLLGLKGSGHGRRGGGGREELITQHGFDTKYAAHAVRLGYQGLEYMETGEMVLPMVGEAAQFCRAVRRGEIPFPRWWDKALELDQKLSRWENRTSVRAEPEWSKIKSRLVEIHQEIHQG